MSSHSFKNKVTYKLFTLKSSKVWWYRMEKMVRFIINVFDESRNLFLISFPSDH